MTELHPSEAQTPQIVIPAKAGIQTGSAEREAQTPEIVIPAKAGIQAGKRRCSTPPHPWIPAFAGMTEGGGNDGAPPQRGTDP